MPPSSIKVGREGRKINSLRERIAREIAAHKRKPDQRDWPFLNNFHCRLPGGLYRAIFDQAHAYADARASRKLRGMTLAQFFRVIDGLIGELGLDANKIMRLQSSRKIYTYVFPLYVRLREEGFKHYPDLTS